MTDFRQLRTVKQLATESGGAFTEGSLRWAIFNEKSNGLDRAVVRLGRRVLIDVPKFNEWIDSNGLPRTGSATTGRV